MSLTPLRKDLLIKKAVEEGIEAAKDLAAESNFNLTSVVYIPISCCYILC
jgi:hypothetical protein